MIYAAKLFYDKETGTAVTVTEEPKFEKGKSFFGIKVLHLASGSLETIWLTKKQLKERFVEFSKAAPLMNVKKSIGVRKNVARNCKSPN